MCSDMEDCMTPKSLSGQPHPQTKEPRAGSAWEPSALLSLGPVEPIRAPQRNPSPALWINPSPTASCNHIAELLIITAVGCKNYIDLFALQKANLCQSTTWQVFMFFHWINLTLKHPATIFISMEVNSSYSGPQLLWQPLCETQMKRSNTGLQYRICRYRTRKRMRSASSLYIMNERYDSKV